MQQFNKTIRKKQIRKRVIIFLKETFFKRIDFFFILMLICFFYHFRSLLNILFFNKYLFK